MEIKKQLDELRKYEQKIRVEEKKEAGKRRKGPKLSDYSRWFTNYKAGSLEMPGFNFESQFFKSRFPALVVPKNPKIVPNSSNSSSYLLSELLLV